jgi:HSP20 family protein
MRDDDRDDPFDEFFEEIERMMNEMMGGNAEFRVERPGAGGAGTTAGHDIHVDIQEADDELRVVADIPGVDKEAIDLQCDGETLTLQASGDSRDYRESITLPTRVDEHSADATYNNGILEVSFDPATDSTDIDL